MIARTRLRIPVCLFAALGLLGACSDEDNDIDERLFVFIEDIATLSDAPTTNGAVYQYALWRTDTDTAEPRLINRFDSTNGVVNLSMTVDRIETIETLFVTLESVETASDTPSRSVLIAGDMIDGRATLNVEHPFALGTSFEQASGTFRLATPTTVDDSDFDQGVWWYDVDVVPVQSLFLPDLPQGWLYEGWIISGDEQRSTGKFADPSRFDLDGAGAFAANGMSPPAFPGQDYISDPLVVAGSSIAVTLEPNPDNSLEPFSVRVMFDQIAESLRVNQPMANVSAARLPVGSATTNLPR